MEQNTGNSLFELQIDHNGSSFLGETARWAKFLAILGFIGCGIMLLFALFAGSIIAGAFSRLGGGAGSAVGGGLFSVVYILEALLWFFPCLYLYNFSGKMKIALRSNDQEQLNQSLKNLKACYRFVGILAIIGLGLAVLFVLLGLIGLAFR